MKFQVPQFIETETKLVGPLTLWQFLWVASGTSIIAVEYILTSGYVFFILFVLTAGLFSSLAFVKVDGQPFLNYLAYMVAYVLGAKQYTYRPPASKTPIPPHGL